MYTDYFGLFFKTSEYKKRLAEPLHGFSNLGGFFEENYKYDYPKMPYYPGARFVVTANFTTGAGSRIVAVPDNNFNTISIDTINYSITSGTTITGTSTLKFGWFQQQRKYITNQPGTLYGYFFYVVNWFDSQPMIVLHSQNPFVPLNHPAGDFAFNTTVTVTSSSYGTVAIDGNPTAEYERFRTVDDAVTGINRTTTLGGSAIGFNVWWDGHKIAPQTRYGKVTGRFSNTPAYQQFAISGNLKVDLPPYSPIQAVNDSYAPGSTYYNTLPVKSIGGFSIYMLKGPPLATHTVEVDGTQIGVLAPHTYDGSANIVTINTALQTTTSGRITIDGKPLSAFNISLGSLLTGEKYFGADGSPNYWLDYVFDPTWTGTSNPLTAAGQSSAGARPDPNPSSTGIQSYLYAQLGYTSGTPDTIGGYGGITLTADPDLPVASGGFWTQVPLYLGYFTVDWHRGDIDTPSGHHPSQVWTENSVFRCLPGKTYKFKLTVASGVTATIGGNSYTGPATMLSPVSYNSTTFDVTLQNNDTISIVSTLTPTGVTYIAGKYTGGVTQAQGAIWYKTMTVGV